MPLRSLPLEGGGPHGSKNDAKHRFWARVVEGVSRLSLIISKKLVIVRFNSFRHLLRFKLRKCHLPREGGLGYFIETLRLALASLFLNILTHIIANYIDL